MGTHPWPDLKQVGKPQGKYRIMCVHWFPWPVGLKDGLGLSIILRFPGFS